MLFSKIPKWVKNFPYALDREALITLAGSSGGRLEQPREMNFSVTNLPSLRDADAAASHITRRGFMSHTTQHADAPGKYVVNATKTEYVIDEETYLDDSAFFNRIANLYGATYDGWYASN